MFTVENIWLVNVVLTVGVVEFPKLKKLKSYRKPAPVDFPYLFDFPKEDEVLGLKLPPFWE